METHIGARRAPGRSFIAPFALILCTVLSAASARSEEQGAISGKVTSSTGDAAPDARVTLVELRRRTSTDPQGAFRFDRVPVGTYLLEVVSPRFGSAVVTAPVAAGQTVEIAVRLDLTVHHEDIVVSASPYARGASSVAVPVTVVDGVDLQAAIQPTLGETLAREPGVSATSFSPGVSRPVIRGQGGDRIRVLEDGIGVGDASNVSEDHAVAFDPMSAERIEVVRGPATLLYGSNATGGIVNVLDGRIPTEPAEHPIAGSFEARYGSNADEGAGLLSLDGGAGPFGWHLDGLKRSTDDFESPDGVLTNSDLETEQGTAGASWVGKTGYAGASWGRFETNYGIPNPDEPVRIDMQQDRVDLKGEYTSPFGIFSGLKVRAGRVDYEHSEIEDTGEVGATFFNDAWEGRIELAHRQVGRFRGAFGAQYYSRDFEVEGEEAFVPPTTTRNSAIFAFEEITAGAVTFEVGARFESQDNTADDLSAPDRSFNGVSGSGGLVWRVPHDCSLAFTLSRSERLPSAEELYANGPHLATFEFQVGDPNLSTETGLTYDLSFRRSKGAITGSVGLFFIDYNGYIFLSPTGNQIDIDPPNGEFVPEFVYTQVDSAFRGAEAHVDIDLYHADPRHVTLEVGADTVRAEDNVSGEPLPRITPTRYSLGVRYRGPMLWALVEGRRTEDQTRTAPLETPTEGYTWLNAALGWRLLAAGLVHDFILRGTNLTDELARNHVSPLKDIVPLPGRDVSLSYRLTF
jgi:iron complex outermembrane receptor protein